MDPRLARRMAAVALLLGAAANALFDGAAVGINLPFGVAIAVVTLAAVRVGPIDRADLWLPVLAITAAIPPALRTDPAVLFLDVLLIAAALAAWSLATGGIPVTRRATVEVVALGGWAALAAAAGAARVLRGANADGALERPAESLGRGLPILRGLLVAVPVIVVFTVLLASADAVFSRGLELVGELGFDPVDPVRRATWALLAAWPVAGLLALAAGTGPVGSVVDALRPQPALTVPVDPPEVERPASPRRWRGEALTVLALVDVLFAAFVALQVAYLFGGRDTLELTGLTYSEYARQGYFQLVAVVVLAGLLLVAGHAVAGPGRATLAVGLTLLALIGVILLSAAYRLHLYQAAYGWTELRFYVGASIAWLAIAVVVAAVLLYRDRMRWLAHGLAFGAVAITLAISYLGPQAFVGHQNLARALDPALVAPGGWSGFDAEYAIGLGDDTVPELVAALGRLGPAERATVLRALADRRTALDVNPAFDHWAAWNLSRTQAREALVALPDD